MITPDDLVSAFEQRRKAYAPMHAAMLEIREIYDGEALVRIPGLNRDEKSSVPNLLSQGLDQMAGRIASVTPMISFSSEKPGERKYDRRAETARRTISGWWQRDRMPLKNKIRGRHLVGYGMTPVSIRWNEREHRPTWHVREPLETFAAPSSDLSCSTPTDVIFAYRRSVGWMRSRGYGAQVASVLGKWDATDDDLLTILEFVCPDYSVLVVTGSKLNDDMYESSYSLAMRNRAELLQILPNPSGVMCATTPSRLTLSRAGGQFDAMVGMYYVQSKLMALELAAVEKGVYPDTYLVSRPNEIGRYIEGPFDGRSGQVNVIAGGDIRELNDTPGYMTPQTIDRLERAQRLTAGIPAEFGGESASNIRTGRRGDAVLSAVIDFPVGEAQDVLAYSLIDENKAAISLAKFYDGSAPRTIYVGTGTSARAVSYVADEVFSNDEHIVSYAASGTDLNSLMIGLGQRVGMGIMSKETAAELDPFIDSPELERDRIVSEGLEQALVSGIQQQAASGQLPPLVVAKVIEMVKSDRMELAEAITKVVEAAAKKAQEDAMKAQEAAQQQGQQPAPSADSMMGQVAPQALAGQSPIPGPSEGQNKLSDLLGALRRPGMTVQPQRNVPQGGM
jgi:hypothetical protein